MNLATGGRMSLNDLRACAQRASSARSLTPVYTPARAGDVQDSQADISKASRLLGYRPLVSFEDGLAQTVDWCRRVAADSATSSSA